MTKGIGTYLWMAPEVVNQEEYSFAADVYSFGMVLLLVGTVIDELQVLWELLTRKLPERDMEQVMKGYTPPIPSDCLPGTHCSRVTSCCIQSDSFNCLRIHKYQF